MYSPRSPQSRRLSTDLHARPCFDRSIGEIDKEIALLQAVPIFQPLPLLAIEQLARGLEPVHVPAGQAVFPQGDPTDSSITSR